MNLIEIQIVACRICQHLPPLDQLPLLKELYLDGLPNLEFVDSEGDGYINGRETFFPSLVKLHIWNCSNLNGWWKEVRVNESDDLTTASVELPEFSSLSMLEISNCPQLSRLPLFTSLNQKLDFDQANLEPLQQHTKMIPESPLVCVSSLSHVEICIRSIDGYQVLPSFHQIPSLKHLRLVKLNDLEYVSNKRDLYLSGKSGDSTFFPSLMRIYIKDCKSLKGWWKDDDNFEDAIVTMALELPQFPCLSTFDVRNCPNFTQVPGLSSLDQTLFLWKVRILSWMSSLVNLVEISVINCTGCQLIPPLDQLPSLQSLYFSSLKDLEHIEFDVSRSAFFPSLKKLSIWDWPSLEGWRKIRKCDDSKGDTLSTSGDSLPEFHCLSSLEIHQCPLLISLPLSPTLSEKLYFVESNLKSFPSNFSSLTNLTEIKLGRLSDLEYIEGGEADKFGGRPGSTFFPFLKELWIWQCPNLKGWWRNGSYMRNLPQFPQLSVLEVKNCPNLTSIPRFPNLDKLLDFKSCSARLLPSRLSLFANLKEIRLFDLHDLEYIETEGNSWLSIQAGGSKILLPSLKKLAIYDCPNLKGWQKISDTDVSTTTGIQSDLPYFPCLSALTVCGCPQFTMMPLFPTLEDRLYLKGVSSEILVSGFSVFPPLSNLKWLMIDGVTDLEHMNCPVFPFLRKLESRNCPNLKGWWGNRDEDAYDFAALTETSHFPRLSLLEIKNCPMLTSMPLFPSLDDYLLLKNASIQPLLQTMEMKIKMKGKLKPKMKMKMNGLAMPKSFCSSSYSSSSSSPHSHFSKAHPLCKLKRLHIESVEDFRSLPESWMQNLTSLKMLIIRNCPILTWVPQGLQSCVSLEAQISGCPQLEGV